MRQSRDSQARAQLPRTARAYSVHSNLTSDPSLPRPMVEVTVLAKDVDAAMDAAMSKTREIVNILNFFAPFVPNNPEWAHLAGEAERTVSTAFVVRDGRLVQASSSLKGPLGGLSCKRLKSASHPRPALRRVHELLRDPDRSQVGELVRRGMRRLAISREFARWLDTH